MFAIEQPEFADLLPVAPELFYAGCLSVGLAYTLQLMAQANASTVLAAFILSLESVFAALAGWLILDQYLSYAGLLGCTLIFAAVLMADVIPESWYKNADKLSCQMSSEKINRRKRQDDDISIKTAN